MTLGKVVIVEASSIDEAKQIARRRNPQYVPVGGHEIRMVTKKYRIRMKPRKRKK